MLDKKILPKATGPCFIRVGDQFVNLLAVARLEIVGDTTESVLHLIGAAPDDPGIRLTGTDAELIEELIEEGYTIRLE